MGKRVFIFVLILIVSAGWRSVLAQEVSKDSGAVKIYQDKRVEELVQKKKKLNETNSSEEGYRIQIFSDSGNNSKAKAQSVMDQFVVNHPEAKAYMVFKSPNYKVTVGDFRTKLDAIRYLNLITTEYPTAFIISDMINFPQTEP